MVGVKSTPAWVSPCVWLGHQVLSLFIMVDGIMAGTWNSTALGGGVILQCTMAYDDSNLGVWLLKQAVTVVALGTTSTR